MATLPKSLIWSAASVAETVVATCAVRTVRRITTETATTVKEDDDRDSGNLDLDSYPYVVDGLHAFSPFRTGLWLCSQ